MKICLKTWCSQKQIYIICHIRQLYDLDHHKALYSLGLENWIFEHVLDAYMLLL